MCSRFS